MDVNTSSPQRSPSPSSSRLVAGIVLVVVLVVVVVVGTAIASLFLLVWIRAQSLILPALSLSQLFLERHHDAFISN